MDNEKIEVGKFLVIISRKKMKNINLHVKEDKSVCVSAPKWVTKKQIFNFVESKISWIQKKVEEAKKNIACQEIKHGSKICVFGQTYLLQIEYGAKRNNIILKNDGIATLLMKTNSIQKDIDKFFYNQKKKWLQKILLEYFEKWSKLTNLKVNGFSIRNMKTRWGSCNTRTHTISINVQIFHKPLECLDYLVLHEIAHIYEPSHNKRFKDFLTKYMPDWRIKRKLLKK